MVKGIARTLFDEFICFSYAQLTKEKESLLICLSLCRNNVFSRSQRGEGNPKGFCRGWNPKETQGRERDIQQ